MIHLLPDYKFLEQKGDFLLTKASYCLCQFPEQTKKKMFKVIELMMGSAVTQSRVNAKPYLE